MWKCVQIWDHGARRMSSAFAPELAVGGPSQLSILKRCEVVSGSRSEGCVGANDTTLASVADRPEHAAADLAAADQEELQRAEAREIGVVKHPLDVVGVEGLELVQANEDVAALDAGLGRRALRVDRLDQRPAAELRVRLGHQRRIDRR